MKNIFPGSKLLFLTLFVLTAVCSQAQQQFNITSSRSNNYCNGTCTLFDNPDLNSNPTAVIFITPLEVNGVNLDPHPICAYYNGKQWSVMNVDNSTMPPGSQFNVQYYSKPDEKHFVHVVTKENLVKNNSYIDNSGLNGNPKAQFQFFQNASPNVRGGLINKGEIKIQYDDAAGKWYITNISGKTLDYATGYNIFISSGIISSGINANKLIGKDITTTPQTIASASQTTPLTVVALTEWSLPDQGNIALSPGYCKVIYGSYTNPSILVTDIVIVTGQTSNQGEQLKWTATVDNGSVQINVCNSQKASLGASGAIQLNGRKVNILVLR